VSHERDPLLYPKISIITPSLNQGAFIEQTIQSILNQGYPNLEYIIVDGGSQDNSVEVIRRYAAHLAFWSSEPDRGQSHAINKGLQHATGSIIGYLNSDDQLLPDTLMFVADHLADPHIPWLAGGCTFTNSIGETLGQWLPSAPPMGGRLFLAVVQPWGAPQPACFWKRELFEHHGCFREDLHYVFDTEFQVRLVLAGEIPLLEQRILANAFIHPTSKTGSSRGAFWKEDRQLINLLGDRLPPKQRKVGETLLWLVDVHNPQRIGQPAPSLSEYMNSLIYAPDVIGRASLGAAMRVLGLRKWHNQR
jgi:glycosyltransferase involved in cell wall biosynthesis